MSRSRSRSGPERDLTWTGPGPDLGPGMGPGPELDNKIKNLLGPPQFYKVGYRLTYLQTDRANTRGPGGPKN